LTVCKSSLGTEMALGMQRRDASKMNAALKLTTDH
jgi:hypothetical protein